MIVLRTMVETINKPRVVGKNRLNYQLNGGLINCLVSLESSVSSQSWQPLELKMYHITMGFFGGKKKSFCSQRYIYI